MRAARAHCVSYLPKAALGRSLPILAAAQPSVIERDGQHGQEAPPGMARCSGTLGSSR